MVIRIAGGKEARSCQPRGRQGQKRCFWKIAEFDKIDGLCMRDPSIRASWRLALFGIAIPERSHYPMRGRTCIISSPSFCKSSGLRTKILTKYRLTPDRQHGFEREHDEDVRESGADIPWRWEYPASTTCSARSELIFETSCHFLKFLSPDRPDVQSKIPRAYIVAAYLNSSGLGCQNSFWADPRGQISS